MDEVIFRIFADTPAQYEALNAGELDAVDEIPAQIFTTLDPDGDIAPLAGNQGDFSELAMNAGCGPLGDGHPALKDVEGAPGHQLRHRPRPAGREGARTGWARRATRCRSPRTRPGTTSAWARARASRYDPERAMALLDEAGWVDNGSGVREKDGEQLRLRLFDLPDNVGHHRVHRRLARRHRHPDRGEELRRHPAHADHRPGRVRPVPVGLDALRRPGPDALVLHLGPDHDRPGGAALQRRQLVQRGVRRALRAAERRARSGEAA